MGLRIGAALLAIAAIAMAGCAAGPTAVTAHSPTPRQSSPSPTPTPTPSPVFSFEPPTPSPVVPTPVASILRCRLPISAGSPGSGGFIVFPGGQFVADPASNVVIADFPTPSPQGFQPGYQPGNFLGLTYDRAFSKWLPVPRSLVLPDGSRYVFPTSSSVFVVNIATGARTELGAGQGKLWNVIDVENEGVYANVQANTSQPPAGLWLLPFSGAPRQIIATGYWQAAGGGAAYGFDAPSVPTGAFERLIRLDLKTGSTSTWFDNLTPNSNVLGFDLQGHPIVALQGNPSTVAVLTAPNQLLTIYDGSINGFYVSWGTMADSNGIWLASGNGLFIYRSQTGQLEQASAVTGPLAGSCV